MLQAEEPSLCHCVAVHKPCKVHTFLAPHSSFFFCSAARLEPPAGVPIIDRTAAARDHTMRQLQSATVMQCARCALVISSALAMWPCMSALLLRAIRQRGIAPSFVDCCFCTLRCEIQHTMSAHARSRHNAIHHQTDLYWIIPPAAPTPRPPSGGCQQRLQGDSPQRVAVFLRRPACM